MLSKLKSIPLSAVFVAVFGVVVGLVIGFLLSVPIDKIPREWSWVVSVGVYVVAVVLMVVLFLSKREVIVETVSKVLPRQLARSGEGDLLGEDKEVDWRRSYLLDTSAIIDGRIADVVRTGFLEGELVVPSFILQELQAIADSKSDVRRARGRRGLEILEELRKEEFIPFRVFVCKLEKGKGVDESLADLAAQKGAKIITTDFNLNKVGRVRGVKTLNINELANMVKTVLVPGEELFVKVIQEGKEESQGVAYLPDGTMIVVENGAGLIGEKVKVVVERLFQTEAGRMIFVRPA